MALVTNDDLKYASAVSQGAARIVDDDTATKKQLVSSYRVTKPHHQDLVELAKEVQHAEAEVRHVACGKLQMIAEQMRFLQQQAQKVLLEAKENAQLHNAKCNLVKKPGQIYYLYERESGITYFSILSPQEWKDCPHKFVAAYRLEHDNSWTKLEDIVQRDKEIRVIEDLMDRGAVPSLEYITAKPNGS